MLSKNSQNFKRKIIPSSFNISWDKSLVFLVPNKWLLKEGIKQFSCLSLSGSSLKSFDSTTRTFFDKFFKVLSRSSSSFNSDDKTTTADVEHLEDCKNNFPEFETSSLSKRKIIPRSNFNVKFKLHVLER